MINYREESLKKADQIRLDIEALQAKISLAQAIGQLATHPLWDEYAKGIQNLMSRKNDQLITADIYMEDVSRCERTKTALGAEIRLLKAILIAPDKQANDVEHMMAEIKSLEEQASKLERKYGFSKGERRES